MRNYLLGDMFRFMEAGIRMGQWTWSAMHWLLRKTNKQEKDGQRSVFHFNFYSSYFLGFLVISFNIWRQGLCPMHSGNIKCTQTLPRKQMTFKSVKLF